MNNSKIGNNIHFDRYFFLISEEIFPLYNSIIP
jgi:hypothetical protein